MTEEHNMTLREKTYHEIERVLNNFKNGQTYSNSIEQIQDIFLAQFDAMLAEDIEKIESYYLPNHEAYEESLNATRILEARRLSIKK